MWADGRQTLVYENSSHGQANYSYTVFSGIVDAYLGLTDLDNLDNLSTVNSFNNRQYGSTPRDVHSMDANTGSSTPYGAGGIW